MVRSRFRRLQVSVELNTHYRDLWMCLWRWKIHPNLEWWWFWTELSSSTSSLARDATPPYQLPSSREPNLLISKILSQFQTSTCNLTSNFQPGNKALTYGCLYQLIDLWFIKSNASSANPPSPQPSSRNPPHRRSSWSHALYSTAIWIFLRMYKPIIYTLSTGPLEPQQRLGDLACLDEELEQRVVLSAPSTDGRELRNRRSKWYHAAIIVDDTCPHFQD